MAILDFLGDLGTVLGPAARGYTGGLAQGEQAKTNLLRQREQDQLRRDQLALQQLKMRQDAESRVADAKEKRRDMMLQFFLKADENMRDPTVQYEKQYQGKYDEEALYIRSSIESLLKGEDPDKIKILWPGDWRRFTAQQQAAPEQQQPTLPPDSRTMIGVDPVEAYMGKVSPTANFMQGQARVNDPALFSPPQYSDAPRLQALLNAGQVGVDTLPPVPEPPKIVERPAAPSMVKAPPAYQAKVDKDKALTGKAKQDTETGAARQAKLEKETDYVGPLANSLIGLRGKQGSLAAAQEKEIGVRSTREDRKATADANYKKGVLRIQGRANDIKDFQAQTDRMRQKADQADKASMRAYRNAQINKLQAELAEMADPDRKEYIKTLTKNAWTKDDFGDLIGNPGIIDKLESELRLPKGTLPRDPQKESGSSATMPKGGTEKRIRIDTSEATLKRAMAVVKDKALIKAIGQSLTDGTYEEKIKGLTAQEKARARKIKAILELKEDV